MRNDAFNKAERLESLETCGKRIHATVFGGAEDILKLATLIDRQKRTEAYTRSHARRTQALRDSVQ
jgi:hypothetical protein